MTEARLGELQRTAGNRAVSGLLQRQPPRPEAHRTPSPCRPDRQPGAARPRAAAGTRSPTAGSSGSRSCRRRSGCRSTASGTSRSAKRIRALDASIARQKAAIDKAATKDAKEIATKAMESDAEVKTKADLDRDQGNGWATNRSAFMDYLGCSLGGDAGVERYYRDMVPFGPKGAMGASRRRASPDPRPGRPEGGEPADARDRRRVRAPRAHIHPEKEDMYPGMMIHSLGIAIDWEAYKNVHFKDEAEMALVDAVIGGSHSMELRRAACRRSWRSGRRRWATPSPPSS